MTETEVSWSLHLTNEDKDSNALQVTTLKVTGVHLVTMTMTTIVLMIRTMTDDNEIVMTTLMKINTTIMMIMEDEIDNGN